MIVICPLDSQKQSFLLVARKLWTTIKHQILLRRVPHTVMSWRFLLPNQSLSVQLHRKVFLHAWPDLPRWQWALIALYSTMTWWFFFCWLQIYQCMSKRAAEISERFQIPRYLQFSELVQLSILHSIPPQFYYQYELFQKPKAAWLDYIYTHELPHWHQELSAASASQQTLHCMSDKQAFAEYLSNHGIGAVCSVAHIAAGSKVQEDLLFTGRSLFLKPNAGSQGRGAFALHYSADADDYQLMADPPITCRETILAHINQQAQYEDYLLQPMFKNHPRITELCGEADLVTIRLVTVLMDQKPGILFATLEIPRADDSKLWFLFAIDPMSGKLLDKRQIVQEETNRELIGQSLPFWNEAAALCLEAHSLFPDLYTIGWDVVITDSGVKLLE